MKWIPILIIFFFLISACQPGMPQTSPQEIESPPMNTPTLNSTPQPTPVASPTTPGEPIYQKNRWLGRGVNLGNALEAPTEGAWGVVLKEEYFQLIHEAGFNSVRIPIRWNAHASDAPPYTIDPAFFERVDWAVNQALSRDLAVVVNIHHYEEIFQNPKAHTERFLAIWEQIAVHYRDYPEKLFFELLNEPHDALDYETWNRLASQTIALIRKTNPERAIIVGPAEWNSLTQLDYLKLPEDDRNLIVTFHYYLPFHFTHQGAEWVSGANAWLGTKWQGSDIERQLLRFDFLAAMVWGREHKRPIYLGEFGAYSKADLDSRARWTEAVARAAEENGFSWAYWEFCAGFGVYDPATNQWNMAIRNALLPAK